ncbi:enoyl-CoA hydratase-related protein [Microbacterium sp. NPDC089320]|uniref:enoyl-CoA hydratase-related protein n=1 Tax=Microbacterium sp. NPDC089320 TaxID=3155182 RepID=UPI003432F7CD
MTTNTITGLEVADSAGVTTIRIRRPERRNAVDEGLLAAIADALDDLPGGTRAVVLRGDEAAFSAGIDLGAADALTDPVVAGRTIDAANRLVASVLAHPVPVVAVVEGACAGVAVPLALAADVVIAAEGAYFQLAFTRVGLMPDGGATAIVAASVGRAEAMRLALLAERLDACEAERRGLVARVVAPLELDAAVAEVVGVFRAGPAAAFARTKRAVNAATLDALGAAFAREREGQIALLGASDFAEGALAFSEKRRPAFRDLPAGRG